MAKSTKDRIGLRFGRLEVIDKLEIKGLGTGWKCRCDCGNETYANGTNLDKGNTRSCGCLALETRTTHGLTQSRVYVIWKGMHQRCGNPKAHAYLNYGGRGIRVCERWQIFENFLEDMGHPPSRHSLERCDNNGHYELGNCRWATQVDQLNNRRNNHVLEAFGKKQTVTQWGQEYSIPVTTLKNRIYRAGMSVEAALGAELHTGKKYDGSPRKKTLRKDCVILEAFGKRQNLADWSRETGMKAATIKNRIEEGMPVEEALIAPKRRGYKYDAELHQLVHPRKQRKE